MARIDSTARVSDTAKIGANVEIGPYCIVGPDVTIGDGCKIQNNVSIYKGVTLEDGVFCGPSAVFTNVSNPRAGIERKDEFRRTLTYIEGATGLAVVVGKTLVAVDLFDKPATCRKAWDRLLSGTVMDALEAGEAPRGADPDDVSRCVRTVLATRTSWTVPPEYTVASVSTAVAKIVLGHRQAAVR